MKKILCFMLCFYAPGALLNATDNPKVVVIGAGFAGLTAAYRLQQKGMHVEVYEARHRVGGRVFSVNLLGEIAELGAQNIRDGGDAENLLALVDELQLETDGKKIPFRFPYANAQGIYDFQTLIRERRFNKETFYQELREKAKDACNMEEILLALFKPDDLLYKACTAILTAYEGACPAKLSSQCVGTLYHILLGGLCSVHPNTDAGEIERLVIRGGNGLLAERLAQALSPNVHLNEQLMEIRKNGDGVYWLTFKSGKQVAADRLILTLPCPVYRDLSIDEAVIPKERLEKIRALPSGVTSKLLVPVLPAGDGEGGGCLSEHVNLFNLMGGGVLTLYYFNTHASFAPETIGQNLQETLPLIEKLHVRRNTDQPQMAQDASFAYYAGAVGHSWPNDPFARGSYSYIPAGQEEAYCSVIEIENERVKSLFAPIDRTLFFAGEHTCVHLEICGTMEAAVESGERTARLLLNMNAEAVEKLELDIIPYEQLTQGDTAALQRLDKALHEKGIVGVRGVPGYKEKYARFIEGARQFSALPEEVKEQYQPNRALGETFLGYEAGKEKFRRPTGDWVVDDLKTSYYAHIPDTAKNKWPREVNLKDPFEALGGLMAEVGEQILYKIGLLGEHTRLYLEEDSLIGRMLYYRKSDRNENPYWCGAHFDHGLFTTILPAVYFANGEPIPEPVEAGLFIRTSETAPFKKVVADDRDVMLFQVGEFGQLAKNDGIRATEHRVHKAREAIERYTLAVFFNAAMDSSICSRSVLTNDARYGAQAGQPCTYRQWHEASFKRYLVKDERSD